LPIGCLHDI